MTSLNTELSQDDPNGAARLPTVTSAPSVPQRPYGGYAGDPAETAPGSGGTLRTTLLELLRIVLKRKLVIASIALALLGLGTIRTLMTTPLYSAVVRIQIDRDTAQVVKGGDTTPQEGFSLDFMRTQYEALQSRPIAERVVSALRLADDAEFFVPRDPSLIDVARGLLGASNGPQGRPNRASLDQSAVGIVLGNRAVRPVTGSRMVDIVYMDPSPERAEQIANAYADAFIAANLDKRFQANSYARTYLDDQIKQLKLRLEESDRILLDFAEKEQIVQVTEKNSIAESNLASANVALGALISDRMKNEQLWRQVEQSDAINLPQLLTNTVIDGLRARRNALVTEYQEKLETYKPAYPLMVQIDQKIKEIDRQLVAEVRTIRSALKAAFQASKSQEDELKARIETLKTEVLELQKRMIRYNILKREVDTNRELYNGLLQRFKEVDVAAGVGVNNVFIVEKAIRPGMPSSPQLMRAVLTALGLGLFLGFAVAFVIEKLDDRVQSSDDMERALGLPMLGVIPKALDEVSVENEIAEPSSGVSEAYRSLCTALQFSTERGLPRTLLVTSSGPAEGKSITALATARHFANLGLKVLLIDADLRNPSLHSKLKTSNAVGLSNYLTGSVTPPEAFQATPVRTLAFMATGPLPPNAADLLAGSRMHSLISKGLEVFDLIVIDGPPIMGLADAPLLSAIVEATVFVAAAGQTRLGPMRGALRRLQIARGPVIGGVLTKFDAKAAGYAYGYGYGSDYGYGYRYGARKDVLSAAPSS